MSVTQATRAYDPLVSVTRTAPCFAAAPQWTLVDSSLVTTDTQPLPPPTFATV